MVPRHPNHGLRVVSPHAGNDSGHETETLAETPFSGKARLRELEQLAKTARRVREDAERELADTRTSRAIAEQRISTCERALRKAEDEMAAIRAKLHHQEQVGNEEAEFKSAEDFELAVLLGKATRHEEPTEEDIADLQLHPLPNREKRRRAPRVKPAPFRSAPREAHNPATGKSRRIGFTLLVSLGALIGASLTYTALTTPSIQENVKAIAANPGQIPGQILDELKGKQVPPEIPTPQTNLNETRDADSPEPEPVIREASEPANTVKPDTEATATKQESPQVQVSSTPDIFQQRAIEEQRARLIREAEIDLESRLASQVTTSPESKPAGQTTALDTASHLQLATDPAPLVGPLQSQ